MMHKKRLLACCSAAIFLPVIEQARAETVITVTDQVLVPHMPRLGVHTSGDNYYDAPNRKDRVEENFEGIVTRFIARTIIHEPNVVEPEHSVSPEYAQQLINNGATYTIVAGPDIWKTGSITNIEMVNPAGSTTRLKLTLDSAFTPASKQNGIMVDSFDPRGFVSYARINSAVGSEVTPNAAFVKGDTSIITTEGAPGFGTNSLRLNGTNGAASYLFFTHYATIGDTRGTWRASFAAKAQSGSPSLAVGPNEIPSLDQTIQPTTSWQNYELVFNVNPATENNQTSFLFEATGGSVLVDDVVITQIGDTNPTIFRDDLVNVIDFLKPGVMRYLVNRADRIQNRIEGPLRSYAHRTSGTISRIDWGMHDFFELAEYAGFAPWYTLPGSMNPADVEFLMEYLAGPITTPGGARRAELGREAPWTDSLDRIFCQFGNEWITFSGTGFNGIGYWEALIQAAKSSPWYNEQIVFVTDSQGGAAWNLDNAPSSDALCHGGYMNYGMYDSMVAPFGTPEALARFVLTIPWQQWTTPNGSRDNVLAAVARNVEPTVYEGGNFHTTFGDAPLEVINDIVSSHVGGLAAIQNMLLLQSLYGVRYQNSFNFSQRSFSPGGSFGDIQGNVLLWGGLLSQRGDSQRYRPRFLQLAAANRAMGGDLVQTVHDGPDAGETFTVNALYSPSYANRLEANLIASTINLKPIVSYGYRDGVRRGLILINQDTAASRQVRIEFSDTAKGTANWWRVAPSDPFADNEDFNSAPQVVLEEGQITNFTSGYTIVVPATGMLSLSWEVIPAPSQPIITSSDLPKARVGSNYSTTLQAISGNPPYSWSVEGLPAFLSLNAATGVISGNPPVSGDFPLTLMVVDAVGAVDDASVALSIDQLPAGATWTETGGLLVMEAEHADANDRGDIKAWASATENQTVFMTTVPGGNNALWADGCELSFTFVINTPGTYSLTARRRAILNSNDSAWVGLNGSQIGDRQFTGLAADFAWTPSLVLGNLSAGTHTLQIRRREAGFELDRVALAVTGVSLPSGMESGPPESSYTSDGGNEPAGFDRWQIIHFTPAQISNPAVSGPNAVPLLDGLTNWFKFGLGWSPWQTGQPVSFAGSRTDDGRPVFRFSRNLDPAAPAINPQASFNLTAWGAEASFLEATPSVPFGSSLQYIDLSPPANSSSPAWFVRLQVAD